MNFQTMEYFIVLAEEKNFTRAAARLYITQQSLSSHIAAVEQELGCRLIIRQVPLGLTYAGETFLRYATGYWNSYLTMQHEFCDIARNQTGVLRVGISYTRSYIFMPDIIADFQKKRPNVQVKVYEDSDLIKQLTDGNLDLVITNLKDNLPKIEFRDFYEETIVMAISRKLLERLDLPENEISAAIREGHLNPLRQCPFVMNEAGGLAFSVAQELLAHSDFQPRIKCSLVNIRTILQLCLRDVGACFAPESMVYSILSPEQLSGIAVFPIDSSLRCRIRFGYLKRAYQWSLIDEFIQTALALYPQVIHASGPGNS